MIVFPSFWSKITSSQPGHNLPGISFLKKGTRGFHDGTNDRRDYYTTFVSMILILSFFFLRFSKFKFEHIFNIAYKWSNIIRFSNCITQMVFWYHYNLTHSGFF